MAEAFAKILKNRGIEVYSAGSKPTGKINQQAIVSMKALNYDMGKHSSSGMDALPEITFDWLVTMGCGEQCPSIQTKYRVSWNIPDPKNMDPADFDLVRDLIQKNVTHLIKTIQSNSTGT
ncbi:MAG: arsenate reductase ArsC [Nitrospirae bacterium]|nr:arsenate reductase ArsC [Candidatus Manganitrophaceae bacterium]